MLYDQRIGFWAEGHGLANNNLHERFLHAQDVDIGRSQCQ